MSAIDICNEALAMNHSTEPIPNDADLTNPVGKVQIMAARFYPPARRAALRLAPWACILARKSLTREAWAAGTAYEAGDGIVAGRGVYACTTGGTSGGTAPVWTNTGTVSDGSCTWAFQYAVIDNLPAENTTGLAFAYAIPADFILKESIKTTSGEKIHAEIERGILYADSAEAVLVYVPDEEDDTLYDPLLREVVVAQVASTFAYPLTGDKQNSVLFAQMAASLAAAAGVKSRREHREGPPESEPWADGLFESRRWP